MAGFPNTPGRKGFGEILDRIPVLNPKSDIGGDTFNLSFWQLAGCGLMVPRAWVLVALDGTLVAAAESWNPDQDVSMHPVITHGATGQYTVTYPVTALDEAGIARQVQLRACFVQIQVATFVIFANGAVTSGHVGNVRIGNPVTSAAADEPFLALFW